MRLKSTDQPFFSAPILGLLSLLMLGSMSGCGYPPVLKNEPAQPTQPLLAKVVGHPPIFPIPDAQPRISAKSFMQQSLPPIEDTSPPTPAELEAYVENYKKQRNSALNLLDEANAQADKPRVVNLDIGALSADGNATGNALSATSTPSLTTPQPGDIDVENALDLHHIRIQLMAESP